jgi:hypothetical protein
MGRRKVWQAEELAKHPELRPVEQREALELEQGRALLRRAVEELLSRLRSGAFTMHDLELAEQIAATLPDNGSYDRKPGQG